MRRFAALTALALSLSLPAKADPVVVELFTSQGCSSCPTADAMLGELAGRDDVIALSLHVDYWDWIGWADTFASPAHSARQRAYAAEAGSTVVYTPQFVIGGQDHIAGAKGMKIADAIRDHMTATSVLSMEGGRLRLGQLDQRARLYLLEVTPEAQVQIARGENAGRAVTYHQIVRSWNDLGDWDGTARVMDLPVASSPDVKRIVLAQQLTDGGYPGLIVGAVRAD